jgi:hypothetical protein
MTVDIGEFRGYLRINKHRLDDELEAQPELLFKISEAYELAAEKRDMLKETLDTTDAELDATAREELDRSEEKVTEAMVKAFIKTHRKHETAHRAYIAAKKQAGLLSALKDSFKDRGHYLRDLANLYNANYFERDSVRPTNAGNRATYSLRRQARERLRNE